MLVDISGIDLYVRADNERARRLYLSEGFVEIHRRVGFIRLPDGTEVDDYAMEWTAT